jgi:hypothetical protein
LRNHIRAYLSEGLRTYLDLECRPSLNDVDRLALTANLVTTLHRAVELLFLLRLTKYDPVLAYRMPRSFEEYCLLRELPVRFRDSNHEGRCRAPDHSRTVSLREAVDRVTALAPKKPPNLLWFELLARLRHSVEHHWVQDEALLQRLFCMLTTRAVPVIRRFIADVLEEDPMFYLDAALVAEVRTADGNPGNALSPELAARVEKHQDAHLRGNGPREAKPYTGSSYGRVCSDTPCPVCGESLDIVYDIHYDCDWNPDGILEHADYVPVFLTCPNCFFAAEGGEVDELFDTPLDELIPDDSLYSDIDYDEYQ